MKKQMLKLTSILMIITLVLAAFMPTVKAAPDYSKTEGSLTITKYEVGDKGQNVLKGVTFDIYKVADEEESTEIPTDADILATKQSKTTGEDGIVTFSGLALGRYLVVESEAPSNVVSKIANFLVDIPMTSEDGTELIYDVEVEPKNNTVYGGVVLTKVDATTQEGLAGVEFELQKQNNTTWEKYGETLATADGENDTNAEGTVLEKGKIEVAGLPAGSYRFVENTTLDGYILDNKTTYEFTVSLNSDGTTLVEPNNFIVTNEKPTLTKTITSSLVNGSTNIGNTVTYKIESDIPSMVDELVTFKYDETIDAGLDYTENTVKVEAFDASDVKTELTLGTDYTLTVAQDEATFELVFTDAGKEKLALNKKVSITYDAVLDTDADATTVGNNTNTVLTYSAEVNEDYKGTVNTPTTETLSADVKVYTSGLYIKKVDSSNAVIPTGATFKIATSEDNAKNGIYIDGIELTTGQNGLASHKGLAYGTYWLVETKAPTYTVTNSEGQEETKSYNLLRKPVEITIDNTTYSENEAIEVINRKGFELPATGAAGTIFISILGLIIITAGVKVYKGKKEN